MRLLYVQYISTLQMNTMFSLKVFVIKNSHNSKKKIRYTNIVG